MSTIPGIGPGGWDKSNLASEQERAAFERKTSENRDTKVVYRLYTEDFPNLADLTSRYFAGATLLHGVGIWMSAAERTVVIEIVGTRSDLQAVTHLAGDIRTVNKQSAVLITWNSVSSLMVTE